MTERFFEIAPRVMEGGNILDWSSFGGRVRCTILAKLVFLTLSQFYHPDHVNQTIAFTFQVKAGFLAFRQRDFYSETRVLAGCTAQLKKVFFAGVHFQVLGH